MTGLLQDLLAASASRWPDATALVDGPRRVGYAELEAASSRLAHLLIGAGCQSGDRIAVMLPKSVEAITAFLAALKAGAIYVPLDPSGPTARVARMLEVAECRLIVAGAAASAVLEEMGPRLDELVRGGLVWLGAEPAPSLPTDPVACDGDIAAQSASPPDRRGAPADPAHILFTSGSTGLPKGVVITHANVLAFVSWANGYFARCESDRVSGHSPLQFDLSTYDIFGSLAAGSELHLVPPTLNMFPTRLAGFIRERRLTQWFSAPSVLAYLSRFDAVQQDDFPELRELLWCGEVFPTPALRYWMQRLPHVRFTNLYGPTETTIASSYHTVPAIPADDRATIPIGAGCTGERLHILGEAGTEQPIGELGEICISGHGVTLGYWRDPERTARAFPPLLAADPEGPRMYRTGDLGRREADGLVRFAGRADTQIKSRGHRIELGEIETALHDLPGIAQAVVLALPSADFSGTDIGCAYVERQGAGLDPAAVRQQLGALVPSYMLPSRWRQMDRLPMTSNGKIDRVSLRDSFLAEAQAAPNQASAANQ